MRRIALLPADCRAGVRADATSRFKSQSPASVVYGVNKDGQQTVEITNVAYEVTGPSDKRLLLRTTTRTKQVMDEIGMEASTTAEAWPLGVDPKQKPLYTLKADGRGCQDRGRRAVGDLARPGRHPVVVGLQAGDGRAAVRYLRAAARIFDPPGHPDHALRGLRSSEDDAADARLKEPHVVGVLTYAVGGACAARSADHKR